MTHAPVATGLATAALLLVVVASCANGSGDPVASGSPTPSSPAPTTATTTPPSESEIASEAASVLLRQYFVTIDQLRSERTRPISELDAVAISTQLAAQKKLIQSQRSDGLRQTGSTSIAILTVQSVNLDNTDPQAGKVPTVQIDVCYDVSGVDILDENGNSIVTSQRPDTGWVRYSVSNYEWNADPSGGWRVASGTDLEKAPCDAP